jgi:NADPH:quinone reductase-like Zn-dependent oxidoreductase
MINQLIIDKLSIISTRGIRKRQENDMKAAVLHMLGEAPRYEDFPEPTPAKGEVLVQVRATSLTNISKMMASGSHYDSYEELPAICGVEGVGILDDGTRVYGGGPRAPYGMMAERTVLSRRWCIPVPDEVDDVTAAALPNPALSSWLALAFRAQLQPGETVLTLGATGSAGKIALQIAKHLGAGRVIAVGRNEQILQTLPDLGADATISLNRSDQDLMEAFEREERQKHIDVVLDYVWGHPAEVLLGALTGHDVTADVARTRYVSIGEMAGPTIALASATLRSSGIELSGSGGGSLAPQAISETFPKMWALAASGNLRIDVEQVPLADIEKVWKRGDVDGRRLVFVP